MPKVENLTVKFFPIGGSLMSWSYIAIAKSKESLKTDVRKKLTEYHNQGSTSHSLMTKICDQIDFLIDLFQVVQGQMLKIDTSGHIDNGHGNLKIDLTNYVGTFLE